MSLKKDMHQVCIYVYGGIKGGGRGLVQLGKTI